MRITSRNLDETVNINREIAKDIEKHISYIYKYKTNYSTISPEKRALHILKKNHLIQLPIPDADWGGAIKRLPNGSMVPVINTAQPRLYQYFIYWHEIYHLTESVFDEYGSSPLSHNISTEFDLTERKADYFASKMMMSDEVYDYFFQFSDNNFIHRLAKCMDAFKVPYKAVLIQLYESAIQFQNEILQEEIKIHFDLTIDWQSIFKELSLDETLVKPSYIVDFGKLKETVNKRSLSSPDDRAILETKEYIDALELKYQGVKGTLEHADGKL